MHMYLLRFKCEFSCYQISYMISAWARMCKIFGTEFTQYLPLVMPSVMKAASIKPEVAVIDGLCQKYFFIGVEISFREIKQMAFFAKPWFDYFLYTLFSSRYISQVLANNVKVVTQLLTSKQFKVLVPVSSLLCNEALMLLFDLYNVVVLSEGVSYYSRVSVL